MIWEHAVEAECGRVGTALQSLEDVAEASPSAGDRAPALTNVVLFIVPVLEDVTASQMLKLTGPPMTASGK